MCGAVRFFVDGLDFVARSNLLHEVFQFLDALFPRIQLAVDLPGGITGNFFRLADVGTGIDPVLGALDVFHEPVFFGKDLLAKGLFWS